MQVTLASVLHALGKRQEAINTLQHVFYEGVKTLGPNGHGVLGLLRILYYRLATDDATKSEAKALKRYAMKAGCDVSSLTVHSVRRWGRSSGTT